MLAPTMVWFIQFARELAVSWFLHEHTCSHTMLLQTSWISAYFIFSLSRIHFDQTVLKYGNSPTFLYHLHTTLQEPFQAVQKVLEATANGTITSQVFREHNGFENWSEWSKTSLQWWCQQKMRMVPGHMQLWLRSVTWRRNKGDKLSSRT